MVLFFYGPNTYAARSKLRQLKATYVQKTGSDLGYERLDGTLLSLEQLTASLLAVPFLATSRLVVIERLAANKPVADKIGVWLGKVPETTVAVFYEPEIDQRTNYFKALLKAARPARFEMLTVPQLSLWVRKLTQTLGATIDAAAVSKLIEAAGDDQWRLEQEVNKLVNYDPNVTAENVAWLVSKSPSETIFDLVEQMSGGRLGGALTIFRALVAERTSEIYILSMVQWQLRNLLLAKLGLTSNSYELAKRAGISPFVAGKAIDRARAFSEDDLKRAYLSAVETDYAIKSGQGQALHLVEQLITKVATAQY